MVKKNFPRSLIRQAAQKIGTSKNRANVLSAVEAWKNISQNGSKMENFTPNSAEGRAVIAQAARLFIQGAGTNAAISTVYELMTDKATPAGVRLAAATAFLDRAGITAKAAEASDSIDEKSLRTATASELQAMVDKLQRRIDEMTVDVASIDDSAPDGEPRDTQDIDLYE